MSKTRLGVALAAAVGLWSAVAGAQDTVKFASIIELSGNGAAIGTNWRDAVDMAVEEINAAGGILGKKIEIEHLDTQSNPGTSRAVLQKALDGDPYVVLGPIFSSSTRVNMALTERAGVPQIVGSEAASITQQGHPTIFRTSFGQEMGMPKLVNYLKNEIKAKKVALIWTNDEWGKGGRNTAKDLMAKAGIEVVADVSTEVQQVDFSAEVLKVVKAGADAIFAYCLEEESARFLNELRKQGYNGPLVGETTLISQKVIDLAGANANGARGHVGLTIDAPVDLLQEFGRKFEARTGRKSDHNGIKGYIAVYLAKEATERMGKFDRDGFAKALRGAVVTTKDEPGVLMDLRIDETGDVDRESFLVEVVDGKQQVVKVLPPVGDWKK
ncbi:MAG: ABC transporter substrate-binding protein [Ectothiorhodospiraceae bacterium]|nr:ABC transporter substrate-binding protein [Ectothiorhodospiraceae bacterium]